MNLTAKDPYKPHADAAADLMLVIDSDGVITSALGDPRLLRIVDIRMLVLSNVFQLLEASDIGAVREKLSKLAPGERACLDDFSRESGPLRIVVQRKPSSERAYVMNLTRLANHIVLEDSSEDDRMARAFMSAMSNRAIKAALQPIVDTSKGDIRHYEVLARFPFEGSPAPFIAAAERRGLVSQLDLMMVCAAAERLSRADGLRLAVNVSGESIQRADIGRELLRAIEMASFDRSALILEITESSKIHDYETTAWVIDSLRSSGVKVVLDDFGAGAASFGYLRSLNVDGVKFDGCFLSDPGCQRRNRALMGAIASMCHELGMSAVGERVETETDRQTLLDAGVPMAQGFFFGRPEIDEQFFSIDLPATAVA